MAVETIIIGDTLREWRRTRQLTQTDIAAHLWTYAQNNFGHSSPESLQGLVSRFEREGYSGRFDVDESLSGVVTNDEAVEKYTPHTPFPNGVEKGQRRAGVRVYETLSAPPEVDPVAGVTLSDAISAQQDVLAEVQERMEHYKAVYDRVKSDIDVLTRILNGFGV